MKRYVDIDLLRLDWINSDDGPSRSYLERHTAFARGYLAAIQELEDFLNNYKKIIKVEVNNEQHSETRSGEAGSDSRTKADYLGHRTSPDVWLCQVPRS